MKPYVEFNTRKRIEAEKNKDRWKNVLQINEQCYMKKTTGNLRNRTDVKLVTKKDYLKCASKPSYMSHKIWDNNFAAIRMLI